MPNRLADSQSPYLLSHQHNPVDWWPWGDEAAAEARRRDVPLLISIGYAACHWCHVMAHESFEDPELARTINEGFVAVKVDREERPDVDAVYLAATQAMSGQGGWPMTIFATPGGEPFFCATYVPRDALGRLLAAITTAWRDQRDAVRRQGASLARAIGRMAAPGGGGSPVTAELLDRAADRLAADADEVYGGFGGAPKFPPHMNLLFLLRHHRRTGDPRALEIVAHTCEQMARGGIHDQLAGGFARYSVDDRWAVPHFEKMLYDNALLLRVYTQLWRATGDPMALRVAAGVADFIDHDLATSEGGLACSLDADTGGVEGATYVWTPGQVREALGGPDGDWAAELFGITDAGTFEAGTSVPRLTRDVDAADGPIRARWHRVRAGLLAARRRRPQPERDDKVLAAWNGWAITALAEFAAVVWAGADPHRARPRTADTDPGTGAGDLAGLANQAALHAVRAAEHLARVHLVAGRLRRVSRHGRAGEPAGLLEDYAAVAEAYCAVHQLTGQGQWLTLAGELLDTALARFGDGSGGYHDTADDAQTLIARPADPTDNATPSGRSALAAALVSYAALSGRPAYREQAQLALAGVAALVGEHPRFAGYACATGEALVSGPYEIAVAGGGPLLSTAWWLAPPGAVIVSGMPDEPGVPLLSGRPMPDGRPVAYVCRGFVCDRPASTPEELAGQLG